MRQLAVFSSTDDTFKHMEIAEAVCASAALPVVFKARPHPMQHDLADSPATKTIARQHLSTRKFLAHELVHGAQAHQAIEVKLKGVAGQADYSGSKGHLALWTTQAEMDELQDHLHAGILEHLEHLARSSPA